MRITAADVQASIATAANLAAAGGAALVGNTPAGNIAASTVQAAINELDAEKALLAGNAAQVFSAATAAAGTSTNQVATTAFAQGAGFPAGTRMLFQQTAAPTGWTKDTTAAIDNGALRTVTGTVGTGGTAAFTTAFTSRTPTGSVAAVTGTVGATTLTTAQIPSHTHTQRTTGGWETGATSGVNQRLMDRAANANGGETAAAGGGGSHTHGFTGSTPAFTGTVMDFAVKYYDVIIASKN